MQFPGLNGPMEWKEQSSSNAIQIVEQTEDEIKEAQMGLRKGLAEKTT